MLDIWLRPSDDNALAATISGLYEAEVIWRRGPVALVRGCRVGDPGWVNWFNNRWLLEQTGNIPQDEVEAAYYAALEEPARLAA